MTVIQTQREMKEEDPRARRTRQLLEQAFLQLVAEKDISSVSVRDITQRATVNRSTFYAHFTDKYALLEYCVRDRFSQTLASKLPGQRGIEDLPLLVRASLEHIAGVHRRIRYRNRQFGALIESTLQRELRAILLDWLEKEPTESDASQEYRKTLATIMSWAILGAGIERGEGASALSEEEMTSQVAKALDGCLSRFERGAATQGSRRR